MANNINHGTKILVDASNIVSGYDDDSNNQRDYSKNVGKDDNSDESIRGIISLVYCSSLLVKNIVSFCIR